MQNRTGVLIMNENGIFITFMVFLLVASVLALHDATKRTDFAEEESHIEQIAFNNVNNLFNNMYEEVVSLNKEGFGRIVQQRPMPFEYSIEKNSIVLGQILPPREAMLDAYIDALNIYSVFANNRAPEDLEVETWVVQNDQWDTNAGKIYPDLNFVILPQCIRYDINKCCHDGNVMVLREVGGGEYNCVGGFDYENLARIDINLTVTSIGCNTGSIGGNLAGKDEEYDPLSDEPYLTITINERNIACPGTTCYMTGSGTERIRAHFDPTSYAAAEEIDSLLIYCNAQQWLRAKVGMERENDVFPLVIYKEGIAQPVTVDLNLSFKQKVESFYFTGFSISVEKENFPVKRST